jgi:hypothetical protein
MQDRAREENSMSIQIDIIALSLKSNYVLSISKGQALRLVGICRNVPDRASCPPE